MLNHLLVDLKEEERLTRTQAIAKLKKEDD